MVKFKAGDRVKLTGSLWGELRGETDTKSPTIGDIVTIDRPSSGDGGEGIFRYNGSTWYVEEDGLDYGGVILDSEEPSGTDGRIALDREDVEHLAKMLAMPAVEPEVEDPVNSPSYYVMPNGVSVSDISQWLTSAGAQAVQYIARGTRIDGLVKGDPVEDIDKAMFWLNIERERLLSLR